MLKTNSEAAFAVSVEPAKEMTGGAADAFAAGAARDMEEEPMKTAEAPVARLTTVSETVIAEPGTRVCEPMT